MSWWNRSQPQPHAVNLDRLVNGSMTDTRTPTEKEYARQRAAERVLEELRERKRWW